MLSTRIQPCERCGEEFTSTKYPSGWQRYCSNKCRRVKAGENKACAICGSMFYVYKSKASQIYCGAKCQALGNSGTANANWHGGVYMSPQSGHKLLNIKRDGWASPMVGEHRIVASKAIGRMLERNEPVIHINNVKTDNRPENLFICGTNSEMCKYINGSAPWPTCSNLDSYK